MTPPAWQQEGSDTLLRVRIQPKASRNAWQMLENGQLRIALTAPPVDGEANRALIAFLAKSLGLPKSRLRLEHGLKSREKTLRIIDAQWNDIETHLLTDQSEGKA